MGLKSQLARFAVQSNHLKSGGINPKLFRPTRQREVSVSRVEGKTHEETIEEGKRVVGERRGAKTLYGWAQIAAQEVYNIGLIVHHDDIPLGHSTIVGWPEEEEKFLPYQQKLAERATKKQLPQPIAVPCNPPPSTL
jgi:hypothetical protein